MYSHNHQEISCAGRRDGRCGFSLTSIRKRAAGLVLCLSMALSAWAAAGSPPGCAEGDCGLKAGQPEPYPHFVIAPVAQLPNEDEMRRLYRWAKGSESQELWKSFADDEADYVKRNQLFVLPAGESGQPVMVHMSADEFRLMDFQIGDWVRYSPRLEGRSREAAGIADRFSALAGCILILCRKGDERCIGRYRAGIYRMEDGVEMSLTGDKPVENGVTIDTVSMLPKKPAAAKGE